MKGSFRKCFGKKWCKMENEKGREGRGGQQHNMVLVQVVLSKKKFRKILLKPGGRERKREKVENAKEEGKKGSFSCCY